MKIISSILIQILISVVFLSCKTSRTDTITSDSTVKKFKIDQSIKQMRDLGAVPFAGVNYPWGKGPGNVGIGNSLSFDNVPPWFSSSYPGFHRGERASFVLPWCVIGFGKGNTKNEAKVEMRNWEMFFKQNGVWTKVVDINSPTGAFYDNVSGNLTSATEGDWDGTLPIKILKNTLFHGWADFANVPSGEIEAIACSVEMRVVKDSGQRAFVTANIGADPYPANKKLEGIPVVAIMLNAPVLIKTNWTFLSTVTFSDIANQEPGGGITTVDFRNNPPNWRNVAGLAIE
jgi:hypothetical protein